MQDIGDLLEQYGLARFISAFAEAEIELQDVPDLSDSDLEGLGLPLGPRRRLQKAIRELAKATVSERHDSLPEVEAIDARSGWARHPDARQPATVVFADITESTALTERLDPEEAHRVLYGAVQIMGEAVERHNGTVCRFMGDGLLALFGVPTAYESHARQACASALDIQAQIATYSGALQREHSAGIQVRIGVHAGDVVALKVGNSGLKEWDASGPSVPIAARMEQSTRPGTIQLTASTFDLVKEYFEAGPERSVRVKGIDRPTLTVELLGHRDSPGEALFDVEMPLVGRRIERQQISVALQACAEEGLAQTVLLRGEAGIGKSKLATAVAQDAATLGFSTHRVPIFEFGVDTKRSAVSVLLRSLLEVWVGSRDLDIPVLVSQAVTDRLIGENDVVFLNDLLDLPQPPSLEAEFNGMTSARRAAGRLAVFSTIILHQCQSAPLFLLVEDLHWADAGTLEFLAQIVRVSAATRVISVMTMRPSSELAAWERQLHDARISMMSLNPLREAEARLLASQVQDIDETWMGDCIERAGGNPLFLMELLKRKHMDDENGLPTSVQTLVSARLDRLQKDDKTAAQVASVLGQRFEPDALRSVLGQPSYDLQRLVAGQIAHSDGDAYQFTHALVLEGVQASLLHDQKRSFHVRAAKWYAHRDAILHAEHLDKANARTASAAYLAAAEQEAKRYRYDRCVALLERGLQLSEIPAEISALSIRQGEVFAALGESKSAAGAFERAHDASQETETKCRALLGMSTAYRNTGDYTLALETLENAEQLAFDNELTALLVEIRFRIGNVKHSKKDIAGSQAAYQKALDLARLSGQPDLVAMALGGVARGEATLCNWSRAGRYVRECIRLCDDGGFDNVRGQFIHIVGVVALLEANFEEAIDACEQSIRLAPRGGDVRQGMSAQRTLAMLRLLTGEYDSAERHARETLRLAEILGERRFVPEAESVIAMVLDASGDHFAAQAHCESALDQCTSSDDYFGRTALLGVLSRVSDSADVRYAAVVEAEALIENGVLSQIQIWFRWHAMMASASAGDWDNADRHAQRLEDLLGDEHVAICELVILVVRALSAFGRGVRTDALRTTLTNAMVQLERLPLHAELSVVTKALASWSDSSG